LPQLRVNGQGRPHLHIAFWGWLHHCVDGRGLPQLRIDGQGRLHLDAAGQGPPHLGTAMRLTASLAGPILNLLAIGWKKMRGYFDGGWSYKSHQTLRKMAASRGGEAREKDWGGVVLTQICGARACFFGASKSWVKGWGLLDQHFFT
jgi:hypothetical protein